MTKKKQKLTPIQGVLINQSGPLGHRLRRTERFVRPTKKGRRRDDARNASQ
jgi:hypothetical protein